jgi:hypothetical protein
MLRLSKVSIGDGLFHFCLMNVLPTLDAHDHNPFTGRLEQSLHSNLLAGLSGPNHKHLPHSVSVHPRKNKNARFKYSGHFRIAQHSEDMHEPKNTTRFLQRGQCRGFLGSLSHSHNKVRCFTSEHKPSYDISPMTKVDITTVLKASIIFRTRLDQTGQSQTAIGIWEQCLATDACRSVQNRQTASTWHSVLHKICCSTRVKTEP